MWYSKTHSFSKFGVLLEDAVVYVDHVLEDALPLRVVRSGSRECSSGFEERGSVCRTLCKRYPCQLGKAQLWSHLLQLTRGKFWLEKTEIRCPAQHKDFAPPTQEPAWGL